MGDETEGLPIHHLQGEIGRRERVGPLPERLPLLSVARLAEDADELLELGVLLSHLLG